MRIPLSKTGISASAALVGVGLLFGATYMGVDGATRPERHVARPLDFELVRMDVQEVEFPAKDGLRLTGWWIRGWPNRPAIILAHDLGSSKASLTNLASVLMEDGYNLLLLDFRAHGESAGIRSTLGLDERRDVLGAVEYLKQREGFDAKRIGIYGVGMGAYAAVLAAAADPTLDVLVLDSLHPDVSYTLGSEIYPRWGFGREHLTPLSRLVFRFVCHADAGRDRARDIVPQLTGRDLLLLSSDDDPALAAVLQEMYESIPEQSDADGNLMRLPSTQSGALYGGELGLYHERVASFFRSRLIDS